ncbi:MAG: hypothetical protein PHU69_13520 [Fermentimonas sp.]|nr:hypothetical protein [Fermentimonas sp.]
MKLTKNQKILAGVGALAGILFLTSGGEQEYGGGSGAFGGGFGGEGLAGIAGDTGGDGSASPAGLTFNFPSPDTSGLAVFLGDTPQMAPDEQLMPKKATLTSTPVTTEVAKNTVNDPILRLAPSSLKAGSTKTAIAGSNLSEAAKNDLIGYVGTSGNVVNEQQKRVNEALGISLLSQKGNQFSEFTYEEKARSKPQANIFERVIGSVISPTVEQPRTVTAGANILMPAFENIVSDKKSWQGGTVKTGSGGFGTENVKIVPSGGSQAVTDSLQTSKKGAYEQAAAAIAGGEYGNLVFTPTKSSSSRGSSTVVKKSSSTSATTTPKKTWTLAEVKAGKNRR